MPEPVAHHKEEKKSAEEGTSPELRWLVLGTRLGPRPTRPGAKKAPVDLLIVGFILCFRFSPLRRAQGRVLFFVTSAAGPTRRPREGSAAEQALDAFLPPSCVRNGLDFGLPDGPRPPSPSPRPLRREGAGLDLPEERRPQTCPAPNRISSGDCARSAGAGPKTAHLAESRGPDPS